MPGRGVEIEDLRGFVFVSDPQVSPDGGKVAFVHTAINYDSNDYVKHIWMADAETGEGAQFTGGQGKDSNPRWSPDGSRLLFQSSNREPDKKNQLLVISAGGGEAVTVADLENGVMNPEWSSDSRRILFTSRVWEPEKPETDVVVVKRIYFKLNAVGMFPGKRVHLFTVRPGQKPKQITRGEFDVGAASWSPDGKEIAFVTNPADDADRTYVRDIYVVPLKGGDWRKVTGGRHSVGGIS